jgi:opacity protein-like surface antigen
MRVKKAILLAALLVPAMASAQQPREARVEVDGGLHWSGPITFAGVNANEISFGGAPRTVFESSSTLEASAGVEARIGVRLTSILQVESAIALGRTHLATHITADNEAADATITEPVTQYLFEAGLLARLGRWRVGRVSPFAAAGVGYGRQLHDGQTFVETGQSSYVGGGLHYLLKTEGKRHLKSAGIRAEVRGTLVRDGLTLDGATHLMPVLGATLFFRF